MQTTADLFAAPVRRTDPQTSRAAAAQLDIAKIEEIVLDSIRRSGGSTAKQIAVSTGLELNSISPRTALLVRKGLIKDSGEKVAFLGSRKAIIWVLV